MCWNKDNPRGQCKDYKVNYLYIGVCRFEEEEELAIQEEMAIQEEQAVHKEQFVQEEQTIENEKEKTIEDLLFSLLTDEK